MAVPTTEELAASLSRLERQLSHMRLQALIQRRVYESNNPHVIASMDLATRHVMCHPDFYCHTQASDALDDAEAIFSRGS